MFSNNREFKVISITTTLMLILLLTGCSSQSQLVSVIGREPLTTSSVTFPPVQDSTPELLVGTEISIKIESSSTPVVPATEDQSQPILNPTETLKTPVLQNADQPSQEPRICLLPPEEFNFRDIGIDWISQIRFETEDLITFEGWGPRPPTDLQPVTPFPTLEPGPNPYGSNVELKAGQINLNSGIVSPREINFAPLNNPCGDSCPLQVLSTSRNQQWQLVQVSDWTEDMIGIWLVGKDEKVKLLSFIPSHSNWSWAQDISLLWYQYNVPDFGIGTQIVELQSPPAVHDINGDRTDPQAAAYFHTAFSPIDKIMLSTENPFEQGFPDDDVVYVTDLSSYPFTTQPLETIPGIIDIVWNEATNTYLYSVFAQTSTEYWLSGAGAVASVPIKSPQALFDSEGNDISQLNAMPASAMSASGSQLASVLKTGVVNVYSCP